MAVIGISRQYGAGGLTLGKMAAEALGYAFVDSEIIQMVAKKAKVSTDWVESIEREAGGKLLKFIDGLVPKRLVDQVLDQHRGYISEEIYVDLLHKIITEIAQEGDAVIIGRGCQFVLRDFPGAYNVLLIADHADRIRFMEQHYDLTPAEAVQVVSAEEKRRINLFRKFGREDYDHPSLYHLVLNMSRLSLEAALDIVCRLVQGNPA